MWFIGVEVEQETGAPPPKKNPESAPDVPHNIFTTSLFQEWLRNHTCKWKALDGSRS